MALHCRFCKKITETSGERPLKTKISKENQLKSRFCFGKYTTQQGRGDFVLKFDDTEIGTKRRFIKRFKKFRKIHRKTPGVESLCPLQVFS